MGLPTREQAEDEIVLELIRVHEESYGAGASKVVAHVLDDSVLVILDLEVTEAERTMLDGGKGEAVRRMREDFQEVIGPTFIAIVERATGRRVVGFVSRMNVDPAYSVEVFRLGTPS
jgi:uncharacterized protein YbcI